MATRSEIGIERENGKVEVIYCHWDGYIESNGKILLENYATRDKVEDLIKLGDLSILGKSINPDPSKPHTFDNAQDNVCVAYGRDRGEEHTQSKIMSKEDFVKELEMVDYLYLFTKKNEWKVKWYQTVSWQRLSKYFEKGE